MPWVPPWPRCGIAEVPALRATMDRLVAENRFAKAAVEVALFDAWGRTVGLPVYALLGGLAQDRVPVTWALGAARPHEIIEEATGKLDAGKHASFKLKMGSQDPEADVERIEKVASALASRASLRMDINAAWDELTATRYLPRLQAAGVELIEQPLPAWDTTGRPGSPSSGRSRSWRTRACAANRTRCASSRPTRRTSSR
ncbi:muconate and chloromuconate cycloisomerase [Amycolatopsis methanolica 239]|uniref:Muconate and chloromuconate cycloisomerase n=2 Tax=Amycolatopsis methanolica TaxID=1814 RepID=A0A076N044_AMYME|nr:muconate and chloromuconate cycloisomerase [Amycolatopsis methanolica 239]